MGMAHDHLECSVPEQLCDRGQVHTGHHESTGKGVAVAMPRKIFNFRVFERGGEPATSTLQSARAAERGEDGCAPNGFFGSASL